ncbi:MAG: segregation/condensation protein A [Deltaproteobacteria bacterium]|jgi:segregation and condensation protein A|nr:segregation/condensation protein A [Deltaproteobacteria bacterium]
MELSNEELHLRLDIYQGPLDLLLHLIKINEVDIYDIPISLITAQYIEYIERMDSLNLDLVGDFLIMAATLTHIKSKMLLPAPEETKDDQPAEDPRMELVKPLLEYASFRQAAENLASMPLLERDVFTRGGEGLGTLDLAPGQALPRPEQRVAKSTALELVKAWRYLLEERGKEEPTLSFFMETVTIGEKIGKIRAFMIAYKTAHFQDLPRARNDNFDLALCFLAILELARTGFLRLWQDPGPDPLGPRLFLADPTAADNLKAMDYR